LPIFADLRDSGTSHITPDDMSTSMSSIVPKHRIKSSTGDIIITQLAPEKSLYISLIAARCTPEIVLATTCKCLLWTWPRTSDEIYYCRCHHHMASDGDITTLIATRCTPEIVLTTICKYLLWTWPRTSDEIYYQRCHHHMAITGDITT
jgi:hypothetical protein